MSSCLRTCQSCELYNKGQCRLVELLYKDPKDIKRITKKWKRAFGKEWPNTKPTDTCGHWRNRLPGAGG